MKRPIAAALLLLSTAAMAQEPPAREQVDVSVVLIDATVTDRNGNPILGLTKDDFVVQEDGVEQRLDSVDFFTNRRSLDSNDENSRLRVERTREERYMIFFFQKSDDVDSVSALTELTQAAHAAKEFVRKQMVATDRIAVVGHDVRLKVFADFTADRKRLDRAISEAVTFSRGLRGRDDAAQVASILAHVDDRQMMNETGRIYDALQMLAGSVRSIRARKVLVLFSPGFGDISSFNGSIADLDERRMKETIRALNDANVSVEAIRLSRDPGFSPLERSLSWLADETNGSYYRNVIRYDTALQQINKSNAGYYLIAYYPKRRPEGGFQQVKVTLRNPEFRVRARPGYTYDASSPR